MTIIHGPWSSPDDDGDPEDRLPIKMPGRPPNRTPAVPDQPSTELFGPVLEGELVDDVDDGDEGPVLVDPPVVPASGPVWSREVQWSPVRPGWLSDDETRRAAVAYWRRKVTHTAQFHAVRSPVYAARFLGQAPIGAARAVGGATRWARGADLWDERDAAKAENKLTWLIQKRQERVQTALVVLPVVLLLGAVLFLVTFWTRAWWDGPLLVLILVLAASLAGRRQDKPIVAPSVQKPKVPQLTAPIVMRALTVAGLGGKKKGAKDDEDHPVAGTPILVRGPERDGTGFTVVVDLPYGRTSELAVKRHKEIASGLDVGAVQLFLDLDPSSERRLAMWVADRDPYAGKPAPSPLAKCPQTSVWEPHRIGVEPRGRSVKVPLIFNGFLVGSIPRQGKTFTVRNLVAPAILDPYCDVTVLGAKSSDWEDAEAVAVNYCAGEGDDAMVEYAVAALRKLLVEAQAQYDAIRALPKHDRPEGKVTRELQARGFRPHVIVVEECQNIFGHRDETGTKASKLAKEALYLCTALAKVAPAAGFIPVLATQRPSTEVIPADLRDVLSVRFALKVNDRVSSDTILGDYRSARGIESSSLINQVHAGVGALVGLDNGRGGDHTRVRCDLLTAEEFGRVCQVGRQRRVDAKTLRGHAAGEPDPIAVEVSLLDDLLAVFPNGQDWAWSETLCERLGDLRPDLYGAWQAGQLTTALKRYGVRNRQLMRGSGEDRANRRGYLLDDIAKAAEARR